MNKKILALAAVLLLALSLTPVGLAADSPVVYNANEFEAFSSRTKEDVGREYSKGRNAGATYINRDSTSYYSEPASMEAPYAAGTLSADTLKTMESMTNFYRWLVGVAPLQQPSESSAELQAGALIRNWHFAHQVSAEKKPADMDQALWDTGAGASHNILAWGYTPLGAITGWLNEGYNLLSGEWGTVGHRSALLDPAVSRVDFGYSGVTTIGWDRGWSNSFDAPYAAFPAPGYMPTDSVIPWECAWTIDLNTDYIQNNDPDAVVVTITDLATGTSYVRTKADNTLAAGSWSLTFVQPQSAAGINASHYSDGERFRVEVTGLTDTATGKEALLTYTVEFFDVAPYTTSYATSYALSNNIQVLHLTQTSANTETLNLVGSILPDTVQIQTDSGRTGTAKLKGKWVLDEANQQWTRQVDLSTLPDYIENRCDLIGGITVAYEIENYTGSLYFQPYDLKAGDAGEILVWDYMLGCNSESVYQITGSTVTERFNRNSEGYYSDGDGHHYPVGKWSLSDSGKWMALYSNYSFGDAYLIAPQTLTVESRDNPFVDISADNYYYPSVLWAVNKDITTGTDDTHFSPEDICTRNQVVTFLWRAAGEPAPTSLHNPFVDVKPTDYFYTAVLWAVENGITEGVDATHFAPEEDCTRAQVAMFLWRTQGKPAVVNQDDPFHDVSPEHWFYEPVLWASENGITNGTDPGIFSPDEACTRAQIVTFLYRALA